MLAMHAAFQLHHLTPADVPLLRAANALFAEAFADPGSYAAVPPSDSYLETLLAKEHVIALVVLLGQEVVGALIAYELDKFERARRELYIYDLAVADGHRRQGIATALIQRLREIAAQRGASVMYVQADYSDGPAIALYSKLGVREDVLHFDIEVGDTRPDVRARAHVERLRQARVGETVMTAEKMTMAFGWRVYGLGVIALGIICLALGEFHPGQPVPADFPYRTALAYAAAAFMLVAGAAVVWRRTTAWGAAALTAYFGLIVVILMNGSALLAHYAEYLTYESMAIQLAIAVGALIVFAARARIDAALAARLTRLGQLAFGLCTLVFGGAHFVYLNLTAPLVPKWLPPTPEFWAYATGAGHIVAALAILSGVHARLAAILLTAMFASFTPLVHLPMLLADPSSHWSWNENAVNLALTGAAWAVADSLADARLSGDNNR
jgi:ribosomal protein S18 acetylase RimI-like enzyme/uncharacterized membrane protein YphA (DoxX/SURF4 family)